MAVPPAAGRNSGRATPSLRSDPQMKQTSNQWPDSTYELSSFRGQVNIVPACAIRWVRSFVDPDQDLPVVVIIKQRPLIATVVACKVPFVYIQLERGSADLGGRREDVVIVDSNYFPAVTFISVKGEADNLFCSF